MQSFDACGRIEIDPLEARANKLFNDIRAKYATDISLLGALQDSKEAWDGYRNRQCMFEGAAKSMAVDVESQRVFLRCVKRTLEIRIRELEPLSQIP
jgi:uncharacterized protein YecT (DUF1311 family)